MARREDPNSNPFDEEQEVNPFSDPVVRAQVSGQSKYSGGSFYTTDMKKKEKELEAWEKELNKKEQELKRREEALAHMLASGHGVVIQEKNWPSFFPIIHNDIAREIPPHTQRLMYVAFASWLGMVLCLVWNIVAVTVKSITGLDIQSWLLAMIYALAGCPGSFVLWYRPLYRAMSTNSALRFGWFFLVYLIHIGFCIFAAAVPHFDFMLYSLTGIFPAIVILDYNFVVAIFYMVGFGLFCLETLLSMWVLKQVYFYFRGSGSKPDATQGAMNGSL